MFGNKNSAVPYVRIGGVDRQSVLTSNANGNTPVKEIGVNANGNLIFSTDLETFKSVLDLKYSQFKSNDENQDDSWETEKSVSMRASGTLEDGTTKDTGVIVSKEYVAVVNASMKDDTSTVTQISVSNNDATIYSTDGTSTTRITVTPTGAKVNDKEIATTDKLPDTSKFVTTTAQGVIFGDPTSLISLKGSQVRPFYTSGGNGTESLALYADIPDISGKANLSGGNTFSGTQTFNNDVNINGTGKCRSKVLVTYNLGSASIQIRSYGMGRIDYLLGDGKTLRHEFGQAWINDGVTFANAYSTVLWCTATPDCSNDSQIQRFSIDSCSTTKMTFKGGADQIVRWEVWGIIN